MRRPFHHGRVLDVSNNNTVDMVTLHDSKCVAVLCKATEGVTFRDWVYPRARRLAQERRIPFGGYLFLRATTSGSDQARSFLRWARPRKGDLQPVIDAETTDGHSMARVADVVNDCAHSLEHAGFKPTLYGSTSFLESLYAERPDLRRLRVWQAEYPGWIPSPLKRLLTFRHRLGVTVLMWQYTPKYRIRGRNYDMSLLLAPLDKQRI